MYCASCALAKGTAKAKRKHGKISTTRKLEVIFADTKGPLTKSSEGYQYYTLVVDKHTKVKEALLLKQRADGGPKLISLLRKLNNIFHPMQIGHLRLDGAMEFMSHWFKQQLEEMGISLQTGIAGAHTHQSDAERGIRTVNDRASSMLIAAGMPSEHWPYAVKQSIFIENLLPSNVAITKWKAGTKRPPLPIELWDGVKRGTFMEVINELHTFGAGCIGFLHYKRAGRKLKEDQHGFHAAYLCRRLGGHTVLRLSDRKVIDVEKVTTNQTYFPLKAEMQSGGNLQDALGTTNTALSKSEDEEKNNGAYKTHNSANKPLAAQQRFPIDAKVMTTEGWAFVREHFANGDVGLNWPEQSDKVYAVAPEPEYLWYLKDDASEFDMHGTWLNREEMKQMRHEVHMAERETNPFSHEINLTDRADINKLIGVLNADEMDLPTHSSKVAGHKYEHILRDAMDLQWNTVSDMGAFSEEMEPPPGVKILNLLWVFRAKADANGKLKSVKARIPLQGTRKQIPLEEVSKGAAYSPVMLSITIRALVVMAIQDPLVKLWQLDIVCAYVTALIKRDVYVWSPPGYGTPGKVRKVLRALYGDPESGRTFYEELVKFHFSLGFKRVHHDQSLLVLYKGTNAWIRCGWHVDDGAFAQKGDELWKWYLIQLRVKYNYSLDILSHFCGTNYHIDYERGIVKVEQTALIEKALRDLSYADIPAARYPVDKVAQPSKDDIPAELSNETKSYPMLKAIGYATYIHACSRPDIGFALKVAAKFAKEWGPANIAWMEYIWRYLKTTKHKCIVYRRVSNSLRRVLQIFTDASHAGDPDTRRSISGLAIMLAGNLILWKCIYQTIVSHSSTESELMALDKGATTGQLAKWVCAAIGMHPNMPIPIFVDNLSAIMLGSNPIQSGRNLHMHARYFYVRDMVALGEYALHHLGTNDMVSDILVTFKRGPNFSRLCALMMGCAYVAQGPDGRWVWRTEYLL